MIDQKEVVEAPKTDDKTADQILADIDALKKGQLKSDDLPKVDDVKPDFKADVKAPDQVPATEDKPTEPVQTLSPEAQKPKDDVDSWMKKKGFKTEKDFIRSYRELEKELHRREPKAVETPQGNQMPTMPYQPMYQPQQPNLETIAKQYNMAPEDIERLAPLARDIASFEIQNALRPFAGKIQQIDREIARDSELRRLEDDPAFSNPDVQFEMHKILEDRPSIFKIEPAPLTYAFNEALRSLGRRTLEGSIQPRLNAQNAPGNPLPNTPPPSRGSGSSDVKSGLANQRLDPEQIKRLPLAEQEKVLKSLNAFPKDD